MDVNSMKGCVGKHPLGCLVGAGKKISSEILDTRDILIQIVAHYSAF